MNDTLQGDEIEPADGTIAAAELGLGMPRWQLN
jgi:hypothetical protein